MPLLCPKYTRTLLRGKNKVPTMDHKALCDLHTTMTLQFHLLLLLVLFTLSQLTDFLVYLHTYQIYSHPRTFALFSDHSPDIHIANSLPSFTSLTTHYLVHVFFSDHSMLISKDTHALCSLSPLLSFLFLHNNYLHLTIYCITHLCFHWLILCFNPTKCKQQDGRYFVSFSTTFISARIPATSQPLNNYCLNTRKWILY